MFNETVLKIEGDCIPAYEVAHQLELLKGSIMLRKVENYMDPKTENEKKIVIELGENEETIKSMFDEFYGTY